MADAHGVVMLPTADLKPHPRNYNRHPDDQVERLAQSLRRYGQRKAVVVQRSTMRILAGEGVWLAARLAGIETLTVDLWDCSDEEALAYLVDDNRLAELAQPELAQLAAVAGELAAVELSPISLDELALKDLRAEIGDPEKNLQDPGPQEPPAEPVTKPGDLWLCGEHRLLCGDSTNDSTASRFRGDNKATCLLTSPPYHVGKEYEQGQDWEAFVALLTMVFSQWALFVEPGGYAFVNFAQSTSHPMATAELYRSLFVDSLGWQWHAHRGWHRPASLPYYSVSSPRPVGELEYLHTYRAPGGGEEIVRDITISSRGLWKTGGPDDTEHPAMMATELGSILMLAIGLLTLLLVRALQ